MQGSISGLTASGLTLALNNNLASLSPPSGATSYVFPSSLVSGTPYTVTINSQPTGLTCEISNSQATVSSTGANNVPLVCVPNGTAAADYNVIIGSTTNNSVTASVLAPTGSSVMIEYGTAPAASGSYGNFSSAVAPETGVTSSNPVAKVVVTGLSPNTRYYYRVMVKASGGSYVPGNEHSFWTQRAPGSTFTFAVQGDSHPERTGKMFTSDLYQLTMDELAKRQPDLFFMLGDDFSYEGPIQNLKDAYCSQKSLNCGLKVASPTYFFTFMNEGYFNPNPPNPPTAPYNATPYGRNLNALALYNSLTPSTWFTQDLVGENVNNVTGYTPLTKTNSTVGYGTYLEQRVRYLNRMAHSTSLYLVNGNHEQTAYANLGSIFNNAAVFAAAARNKFYVNPTPDNSTGVLGAGSFFTGDLDSFGTGVNGFPGVPGDGLLRDYYAFTWGDALFVTIDPYWHSPFGNDSNLFDAISSEPEIYKTIGDTQYQWLKKTLENSTARYKFIFQHHILGNGRGAAQMITNTEWGGQSASNFNFAQNRPNWTKPLHQLLVDTMTPGGQTIVFTGHDHTYAREMVDGVVYQEVPNPADNSYWAYNCSAYAPSSVSTFPTTWKKADGSSYGVYNPSYSIVRPDTGFIQVTVSPTGLRLDYIRTYRQADITADLNAGKFDSLAGRVNGETDFRYSLPANSKIDSTVSAFAYTCKGDAPPSTFLYGTSKQ